MLFIIVYCFNFYDIIKRMKKYLVIILLLLLFISIFTGCKTQGVNNSISENQIVVTKLRGIYLSTAIGAVNNDIFNKVTFEDLISSDIDQLLLVQNEVPSLKNDLIQFNEDVHEAFRKATVEYQKILFKYSNRVQFPLIYPNDRNYYSVDEAEIDILFKNYKSSIDVEINEVMDSLFEKPIREYRELSTNYNIYCESLKSLNRQSLSQINTDIEKTLKQLFLDKVYYSILNTEKNYIYEKNSFEPYKIIIK